MRARPPTRRRDGSGAHPTLQVSCPLLSLFPRVARGRLVPVRPKKATYVILPQDAALYPHLHPHTPPGRLTARRLAAQAEGGDQLAVAIDVLVAEVVEQAPALAHHHQQTPARVVVLAVFAEMLRELRDARTEQRYLDLGRPGVALMLGILLDDRLLFGSLKRHSQIHLFLPY